MSGKRSATYANKVRSNANPNTTNNNNSNSKKANNNNNNKPNNKIKTFDSNFNNKRFIVGGGQGSGDARAAVRRFHFYTVNWSCDTKTEDVKHHVLGYIGQFLEVAEISLPHNRRKAFRISVEDNLYDKMVDTNNWPRNILITRFHFPRSNKTSTRTPASASASTGSRPSTSTTATATTTGVIGGNASTLVSSDSAPGRNPSRSGGDVADNEQLSSEKAIDEFEHLAAQFLSTVSGSSNNNNNNNSNNAVDSQNIDMENNESSLV